MQRVYKQERLGLGRTEWKANVIWTTVTKAALHSGKTVGLSFQKLSAANKTAFAGISGKGSNLTK